MIREMIDISGRRSYFHWLIVLISVGLLMFASTALAQDEDEEDDLGLEVIPLSAIPILERDPFDRIYLDAASDNKTLDVLRFEGPIPSNPAGGSMLRFTLVEDVEKQYQVAWRHVVKIRTYPELVLDEAIMFANKAGKNDAETKDNMVKAFEHFDFVMNSPEVRSIRGFDEAINDYLYADAFRLVSEKRYREAISVAEELYRRDKTYRPTPSKPTVTFILDGIFKRLLQEEIAERDYRIADRFMKSVDDRFEGAFAKTTDQMRNEIKKIALKFIGAADKLLKQGEPRKAHDAIRQGLAVYPDLKEAQDIQAELIRLFPMVVVGVSQKFAKPNPRNLHNWASRRSGKLVHRTLVEYTGQGQEGGVYAFPQGRIERSEDFLTLNFVIREKEEKPGLPLLDAHTIRRRLLSLADRNSTEYLPAWDRLLKKVSVLNDQNLEVQLRFSHVLPEALLQVAIEPRKFEELESSPNGFYAAVPSKDKGDLFKPNPRYERASKLAQMPDLVEIFYEDSSELLAALKRGDIDMIDRVFPGQLYILEQDPEIEVRPYAIPTLHMLIPNLKNPHMKNAIFRRSLLYAIDRETILNDGLLAGSSEKGFELLTGPFPIGIGDNDPISYGYNFEIKPLEYSPFQATTLLLAADQQLIDAADKKRAAEAKERGKERGRKVREGEMTEEEALAEKAEDERKEKEWIEAVKKNPNIKKVPRPTLRLAHSSSDIATVSCELIKQQLKVVGVDVVLIKLPAGETVPESDEYDLLYTEVMMEEPLIDARGLLSESGLVYAITPMVERALNDLDAASSWSDVSRRLNELHFSCNSEGIVLPLWQTVEHFAYRKNVNGVGKKITNLYENVQDWKIVPEKNRTAKK